MRFGSWWIKKIDGLAGETESFSMTANRTQSANRAVGGKLFVTDRRLLFSPHIIDALTGGQQRIINFTEIANVSAQNAGGDTFGGGLRNRLRIDLKDGSAELFVVNNLDKIIGKLQLHITEKMNFYA